MGFAGYAAAVSLYACPFCREMFQAGEATECPVCGMALKEFAKLPPSIEANDQDGVPFSDRLIFNRIQIQPPDTKTDPVTSEVTQPPNNVVHDLAVIRVRNTGSQSLNVSSMTVSAGWQLALK